MRRTMRIGTAALAITALGLTGCGRGDSTDEGAAPEITQAPAERSPWPMVLFAGVALMIGATLLRWILVPRAG